MKTNLKIAIFNLRNLEAELAFDIFQTNPLLDDQIG